MATWTQSDIDKLRTAIVALASGELVQQVRYDGPPARSVTYHATDLRMMREILNDMQADVARDANRPGAVLIASSKGL